MAHLKSKKECDKYTCDQCDYKTVYKNALKKHFESKHEGVKFPCDQCDFQAKWKTDLIRHLKSTHNGDGVKYPCDQCDYKATQMNNLLQHIGSIHEGVKYACDQCDFQAKWKRDLRRHLKSKHEGVKYPCDQCDNKFFVDKRCLIRHIRSTHDEVKYPCNQCEFIASREDYLKRHLESKHEDLKYPCDQCENKYFLDKQSLMRHIRTNHEGPKHPPNDLLKSHLTEQNNDQKEYKTMKENQNVPKEKNKRKCWEEPIIDVIEEVDETNFDQAFENCCSLILKASRRAVEIDSKKKLKMLKAGLKPAPEKGSRKWTMYTKEENSNTTVTHTITPDTFEARNPALDEDIRINGLAIFPRFTSTPELEESAEEYTTPVSLPASTKEELCPALLPSPREKNTPDARTSPPPVKILLRRTDNSSWKSINASS